MSFKNKIEYVVKRIIFFGLILFLFTPLIQDVTHFKKYVRPLDGAFHPEQDISFSWEDWFNGDYASTKEKFIKESFGFRNYFVRLICQVNFSLFKTTNVTNVVIGKNNYLYETPHIDAYYGRDFIGSEKIEAHIRKLKEVQDTLAKCNKLLMVVFAPSKASFYPEYIPNNFKGEKTRTNYEGFINAVKKHKLNHIDFYKYFNGQKTQSKYPLYPQLGIHWSDYGSVIVFDSINRYAESKLKIDMPDLKITNIEFSDSLQGTDNDAIKSLNLLKDPKSFKMAYPKWVILYDSLRHKKIKTLVVSDSFWWYIYSTNLPIETYAKSSFWFYNREIYPESYTKTMNVPYVDYSARIREADLIVIMHSEATLRVFGGGFDDMCHETYFEPTLRRKKILEMKDKIRSHEDWYNSIVEEVKTTGLSVDSALTLNAIYVLEQERDKEKTP